MFSANYPADAESGGPRDAPPLDGSAGAGQDFEAAVAAMMAHPGQAPQTAALHSQWGFLAQDPIHAHAYGHLANLQTHDTITPSSTILSGPDGAAGGLVDLLMASAEAQGTRQRTSHACDKCRERKSKCSGDRPICERCTTRGLVCHYADPINKRSAIALKIDLPANNKRRGSADVLGTPQKGRRPAKSASRPRHKIDRSFSRSQPCSPIREAAVFSWMPSGLEAASSPQHIPNHYAQMEAQEAWRAAGKHSYLAGTLEGTRGLDNVFYDPAFYQDGIAALPQRSTLAQPMSQELLDGTMMHDQRVFGFPPEPQRERWSFSDSSDGEWTEFSEPPSATRSEFSLGSEPHSRPWSASEAAHLVNLVPSLALQDAFQYDSPPSDMGLQDIAVGAQEGHNDPGAAASAWFGYHSPQKQQFQGEIQEVPLMYPKPSLPSGVSDLVERAGDELVLGGQPSDGAYFGFMGEEGGDMAGVVV